MRVLLFFLIGAVFATCTPESILNCYLGFIDLDGDNGMNATELNHFLMYHPCSTLFTKHWGTYLLDNCDVNYDGVFNSTDTMDWKSCLDVIALNMRMCEDCTLCNAILAR